MKASPASSWIGFMKRSCNTGSLHDWNLAEITSKIIIKDAVIMFIRPTEKWCHFFLLGL
jgi:hypothetical protein